VARPKSADAVYLRIAAALRERIRRRELRPGDLLPSEAALCEEFGVARGTAREAFAELQRAGLVEVVPGVGRVVRSRDRTEPAAGRKSREIAAELRRLIADGQLASGDLLPSESELARRFAAARSTVQRAMRQLETEGVVKAHQGKGRRVL